MRLIIRDRRTGNELGSIRGLTIPQTVAIENLLQARAPSVSYSDAAETKDEIVSVNDSNIS